MDLYNIRIINSGRNEYRGNIVIDENDIDIIQNNKNNYKSDDFER